MLASLALEHCLPQDLLTAAALFAAGRAELGAPGTTPAERSKITTQTFAAGSARYFAANGTSAAPLFVITGRHPSFVILIRHPSRHSHSSFDQNNDGGGRSPPIIPLIPLSRGALAQWPPPHVS